MVDLCTFKLCLEVHHIVARADGGSDTLGNLITLCPNHHAMAHRKLITAEQFNRALARRKSTARSRMVDWSEILEYAARASVGVDGNDPRAAGEYLGRMLVELPPMVEVMFGTDFITASLDFFRKTLRDGRR